jgi:hypothetical protein
VDDSASLPPDEPAGSSAPASPALDTAPPRPPVSAPASPAVNPYAAAIVAWLVPGAGHLLLRRSGRALIFFLLVLASAVIGWMLEGKLYRPVTGQPLQLLGTVGSMGMGIVDFALRWGLDYQGDVVSPTYEYGTAFLLTAGLMNLLVVLDAWDIALGKKE